MAPYDAHQKVSDLVHTQPEQPKAPEQPAAPAEPEKAPEAAPPAEQK